MRVWVASLAAALAPVACGAQPDAIEVASPGPAPPPPATAPLVPEPPAREVLVAPSTSAGSTAELELVASCVTRAIEQLGWLPVFAHQGAFMRTALERIDLPEDCAELASDEHVRSFPIAGGGSVAWHAEEPRLRGTRAELELVFECRSGCSEPMSTKVSLPRRWHCFGWVHGRDHGTGCGPSRAACESLRRPFERGARPTTPCELQTGAAYCDRDDPTRCFPTPWDCEREVPDGAGRDGRCVEAD